VPEDPPPDPPAVESDAVTIARVLQQYGLADDSLESPALTLEACDTEVSGDTAVATCQGSASTSTFTLRRSGDGWAIDTARVDRAR